MSRFRIAHPSTDDICAYAGTDHAIGPFCEIFTEDRIAPIASVDVFELGRPATLDDIFELLMEFAFFSEEELREALVYLQDGGREPRSRGVMRVVGIVERLRGE